MGNFWRYHPSQEPVQDDNGGGTYVCTHLLQGYLRPLTLGVLYVLDRNILFFFIKIITK